MPKSPRKSPEKKRAGVLLSDKPIEMEAKELANKKAAELGTECKEIRKYANGAIGVYFANGKFLFVRGATKEYLEKARAKRTSQKGGSKSPKRKSQQKADKQEKQKGGEYDKFYKKNRKEKTDTVDEELGKIGVRRRSQKAGTLPKRKVSLKTAVRLLRQYYSEKYSQ